MIIVPNPLTTYLEWLVNQDLGWADDIAANFFERWDTMDETKKLLNISKAHYDAKNREVRAYFEALNRGEEGLDPPEVEWEVVAYEYGDEDDDVDYLAGVRLKRLVDYLNKFIELGNGSYIVEIALQLYSQTDYMLFRLLEGKPPVNFTDYFRNKHIKSLLDGDLERAEKEEEELRLIYEEETALLATKASWVDFVKEDFNQKVILAYQRARWDQI